MLKVWKRAFSPDSRSSLPPARVFASSIRTKFQGPSSNTCIVPGSAFSIVASTGFFPCLVFDGDFFPDRYWLKVPGLLRMSVTESARVGSDIELRNISIGPPIWVGSKSSLTD